MTTEATEAVKTDMNNTAQAFMQMLSGFWVFQMLNTVAKLGIADQLKDGPQAIRPLSQKVQADEVNLYRVMRALAGLGIFAEKEARVFELTPMSQLLCSDTPNSMLPVVLMLGEVNYSAWGHLFEAVRSGGSPFEMAFGMPPFDYFEKNPKVGEYFNAAMTALVRNDQAATAAIYDFSQFKCIVDVGGGHGMLLAAILKRHPNVSAILFDLPHVVNEAGPLLKREGIEDRCRTAGGNFFESVVEGGDAYILSHTIHGFSDEQSITILKNVHRAMPEHGKLLLVEDVLNPLHDPSSIKTKLMDINMLVMTGGGRERTREEFSQLFQAAGFKLTNITPTPGGTAVIEGVKQ